MKTSRGPSRTYPMSPCGRGAAGGEGTPSVCHPIAAEQAWCTDIDYSTNQITVAQPISWNAGDGVSLPYSGAAPDLGAFEEGADPGDPPGKPEPPPTYVWCSERRDHRIFEVPD
jgi:hypothetical protein